jgi:diguanylate cyclase (GGDEF)-like protein
VGRLLDPAGRIDQFREFSPALIEADLRDAAGVMDTLRDYFESSENPVSRDEFLRFAGLLHPRSIGLMDLVWAPRVTAEDRDAFEQAARAAGLADFQIGDFTAAGKLVRAGRRDAYYSVLWVEPGGVRRGVMGLDLMVDQARRGAIQKAIETGQPAATPPLPIVTAPGPRAAVYCYVPVFRGGRAAVGAAGVPLGLVFAAFETVKLVENIIGARRNMLGIDIYFYDPGGAVGDRLIYWRPAERPSAEPPTEAELRALPHWEGKVALIDQTWGVLALPSRGMVSGYGTWTALVPLAIGLLLTVMVTGYLMNSLRRTRQLETLTTSLRETTEGLYRQTEAVERLARQDVLTELPNRAAFQEALARAAASVAGGGMFALLCLDLDRFKHVNDTLGHPVGDALLWAVAERLRRLVRGGDTVARLGGDEFSIVQVGIAGAESPAKLSQRIIDELHAPFELLGHRVVIGVTIGIALADAEMRDVGTLMRNADLALYRAKQDGRGNFRFFEPEMDAQAQARRQLELDLRRAIDEEEFELHYQPLVSVEGRRVTGFEALIRWRHPTRGMVMPGDFIPLAEEIGLILPIGAWVLRTACMEATNWPERISVAVNISTVQFHRADLVKQVGEALGRSGLAPARLELEITETLLRDQSDATLQTLRDLRALGVRIAMDDFGSGYSSLNYLRRFMFDRLKVHSGFIGNLADAGDSAAIARAIAGMGRSLGIETTAEGVETEEQMARLVGDGFTELQGYLFAKPCAAADVPRLLAEPLRSMAAA